MSAGSEEYDRIAYAENGKGVPNWLAPRFLYLIMYVYSNKIINKWQTGWW